MRHKLSLARHLLLAICIALHSSLTISLKHQLALTDDQRIYFGVSSFGYLLGGRLEAIVRNLTLTPDPDEDTLTPQYGFILIKLDQAKNPFLIDPSEHRQSSCMLNDPRNFWDYDLMTFSLDPRNSKVLVRCTGDKIPPVTSLAYDSRRGQDLSHGSYKRTFSKRAAMTSESNQTIHVNPEAGNHLIADPSRYNPIVPEMGKEAVNFKVRKCHNTDDLPLIIHMDEFGRRSYSFNFTMFISKKSEEGLYYLTFHNCKGRHISSYRRPTMRAPTRFNLSMLIYETNYRDNYLSAGSMPLPQMYFMLSVMFFLIGCIWVNFITRQKDNALKIHYLMTVLVFAKACSLLFHGINYHYIALNGQPVVTWAYIYYATRSVKGALFFITLALIGSGWSFIKYILSDKDKKIILVIVALQVIAHVAEIVLDESTEGEASNEFWAELCSLVDLFSCIAILYPISWSVKHLEEASRTDGKAAINLKKLEIFKRFYIISTIYIYITRIVTFVFLSMLSYRYLWLSELVSEFSTLVYFIVTGYYFQPMPTNPYLLLSSDQDEEILFSVDSHELETSAWANGTPDRDKDKETLLDQKVTRRVTEEIV